MVLELAPKTYFFGEPLVIGEPLSTHTPFTHCFPYLQRFYFFLSFMGVRVMKDLLITYSGPTGSSLDLSSVGKVETG